MYCTKFYQPTFQLFQPCTCVHVSPVSACATSDLPPVVAGYGDGTVRMFDINKVEMVLKMHPHATAVTAISFSSDG